MSRSPARRRSQPDDRPAALELFAGVGGFRLGLERTGWRVPWSNQWEPGTRAQHASDVYVRRFGAEGHTNEDIHDVLDRAERGDVDLPDHELLVGGFPCQSYSVATTLDRASGLVGDKGVLWWEIHRLLRLKRPRLVFLENVDRLLKSPAGQRGRDFAVMLGSLANLGYAVEWRVVNAAEYGYPQRRRRVLIVGRAVSDGSDRKDADAILSRDGVLARAFPVERGPRPGSGDPAFVLDPDLAIVSLRFGSRRGRTPFRSAGWMAGRRVWTGDVIPRHDGPSQTLADVLEPAAEVPASAFIPDERLPAWRYLKGAKREPRTHRASGTPYLYAEGAIAFPDPLDRPSRTILTGEGGATPSRFKHVVDAGDGRFRRLTPRELERLMGFPDDWTAGLSEGRRAFLMGNALVVGLVERVGRELLGDLEAAHGPAQARAVAS